MDGDDTTELRVDWRATTGLILERAFGLALADAFAEVLTTRADDFEATALEVELFDTFFELEAVCLGVLVLILAVLEAKAIGEVKRVIEAARISETQFFLLNTIILVLF